MSPKLRMIAKAKDDLIDIWTYTSTEWGDDQAVDYTESIRSVCELIVQHPKIGTKLPLFEDVYAHPCKRHIIIYMLDENGVYFLGFLHEKMDIFKHLTKRL